MIGESPPLEQLVLVTGADEAYALPLSVTVFSALRATARNRPVRLALLDGGMSPASRARLTRVIDRARHDTEVEWHTVDLSRFSGAKRSRWGSAANYMRLMAPELLADAERAIYLDGDVLARRDLSELWSMSSDLGDYPVLAVRDYEAETLDAALGGTIATELGIAAGAAYLNSGVMLMNLDRWRSTGLAMQVVRIATERRDLLKMSDQDALNVALAGNWAKADDSWNVMTCCIRPYLARRGVLPEDHGEGERELVEHAAIVHYCGPFKPWIPGYMGPGGALFRRTLYRSGWFRNTYERLEWQRRFWSNPRWRNLMKIWTVRQFPVLGRVAADRGRNDQGSR